MRRFPVLLLVVLGFVSFVLFVFLLRGGGGKGKSALRGLLDPALAAGRWTAGAAGSFAAGLRGMGRSEEEYRRLRERIADLESRLVDRERNLIVLSRQLREERHIAARLPGGASGWIPARVTGIDPSPWARAVWVDRGSADGIRAGAAATAGEALVGRVDEVDQRRARIRLLVDPASAALVQVWPGGAPPPASAGETAPPPSGTPAVRGVLRGTGDETLCRLELVPNTEKLSTGDAVTTTGYDAKYPRGLFVGTIEAARADDVFLLVTVRLPVDLPSTEIIQIQRDLPASREREREGGR